MIRLFSSVSHSSWKTSSKRFLSFSNVQNPFDKVLIANRGEISSRVMRTCKDLGIKTVAIYSTHDAKAPYVSEADETICIGQSYLNEERVLEAIQESEAQACMPGYGFFSENAAFARRIPNNVTWLGPSPEAIVQMGCKIRSKQIAIDAGVSVIPGFEGELENFDHAAKVANDIGYPVLLKAAAGGGGKGMRICHNDQELKEGFPLAKAEAQKFFNDNRLLVEKYVVDPHHIEFQLLSGYKKGSDSEMDILVFCERECSIQRRHQKILEESPSPLLKEETRLAMVKEVKQLVRNTGYTSAGTVEFLVDKDQNFYFLEMNTRLQVEHPVSETVSVGYPDLVKGMLWVGAGWGVPEEYLDTIGDKPYYPFYGHSIEARVYAEDPLRDFLPSTGPLIPYQEPAALMTSERILRIDSGVDKGYVVTPHYDPMLSKVIAWSAEGRLAALDQLHQAMQDYVIGQNIQHNARLVMDVLSHEAFRQGETPTSFLPTHYPDGFKGVQLSTEERQDLAVCMVVLTGNKNPQVVVRLDGIFGDAVIVEHLEPFLFKVMMLDGKGAVCDERIVTLDEQPVYKKSDLLARVALNNGDVKTIQMLSEGQSDDIAIEMNGAQMNVLLQTPIEFDLSTHMQPPKEVDQTNLVLSPMPGTLISYAVEEGEEVQVGQELCVIEAMKMQNIIRSPKAGTIASIHVAVGSSLMADAVILTFATGESVPPCEDDISNVDT
mmetsp:Transcript_30806/g.46732  ORF Transcript_30806/g.46732 Transcript_30806/m.46732 type:complete len:719 (+) Transcript_30806:77-2233(+)